MAFAYVHEFDVGADRSTANYDAISEKLGMDAERPEGLVLHAAGFNGDKFQMIEIWESPEAQQRFERERMMPAMREVADDSAGAPTTTSYELHRLFS